MTTVLETPRVLLREFTRDDLDPLATMVGDPDQMRFYRRPKTRDEASAWLNRNLTLYQRLGFGFWLMEAPITSEFIGYAGIRPHDTLPEIEMGWHTKKTHWRQGLATEVALACRDAAFDLFDIPRLIGIVVAENAASIRVAEKIGMSPESTTEVDNLPCIVYATDRSAFRG